jgi:hypothetical protein
MLNDTEASCLAMALAVCLKNKEKKKRRWMEWLKKKKKKRNEYTYENLLVDVRLSEPSDFQNFPRLDATSFDELLKMVTSRIEKSNSTMRDTIPQSQLLSITILLSLYFRSSCSYCSLFHSVAVILAFDFPQSQ